ncbi:helix-turn-helix domain-containing protein [Thalassolituus hydrocarboniclasticus]|uniref:Helix-turn-helix transcriptional regulator n=1 Tax=Thalassolituus hydrocarboniclasticus TaxID=2742796 RepID=A0ABY6ABM2_9GAMM|nr:AraC family transcriptional regulator [Thalassolituus hydrocarboniclasticus]UXD88057.1 helix-turn-helix transcriptional regulator [Thalassolituus hydrocarboniclasticus]
MVTQLFSENIYLKPNARLCKKVSASQINLHFLHGFIGFQGHAEDLSLSDSPFNTGMSVALIRVNNGHLKLNDQHLLTDRFYLCNLHAIRHISTNECSFFGMLIPGLQVDLNSLINSKTVILMNNDDWLENNLCFDLHQLFTALNEQDSLRATSISQIISGYLFETINSELEQNACEKKLTDSYYRLLSYIGRNLNSRKLGINMLTEATFMSRAGIYRLTNHFGGAIGLINHMRSTLALIDILNEDRADISFKDAYPNYGFSSYGCFLRAFRKIHGVPPGDIRKNGLKSLHQDNESGQSHAQKPRFYAWFRSYFIWNI